jgi:hypothetical protein
MQTEYKTIETINLKAVYSICSNEKCTIERKTWTSSVSGTLHEAWFRRGKIVYVDFTHTGMIEVVSGIGSKRIIRKLYVRA